MALLINQGKQDTTQDNKFNPIVANDVLLEITELKIATTQVNTLEVTFRILDGQYKNRFVFDRVQYAKAATIPYDGTWKYRQLRACAGVPYEENEPVSIDIDALLLHKAVKADLGIRKGKNKDGEDTDYQDIKYKVINNKPTQPKETKPAPTTQEKITTPVPPKSVETKEEFEEIIPTNTSDISITDEDDWA